MKPTFASRYLTRSPSAKSTRLEPSTSIRPAVGRSIPPMRLRSVVFPHPEGPWTATSSPSATCMSRPRSAITSDFPVRYTLIRSLVRMFGTLPTSKLEDPRDVHARDTNRDGKGCQEHGRGCEDEEEQRLQREHEQNRNQGLPCRPRARRNEGCRQERREAADSGADDEADQHDRGRFADQQARRLPPASTPGPDCGQLHIPLERCGVQDDSEASGQDDDHECHLQFDETKERTEHGIRAELLNLLRSDLDVGCSKGHDVRLRGTPIGVGTEGNEEPVSAIDPVRLPREERSHRVQASVDGLGHAEPVVGRPRQAADGPSDRRVYDDHPRVIRPVVPACFETETVPDGQESVLEVLLRDEDLAGRREDLSSRVRPSTGTEVPWLGIRNGEERRRVERVDARTAVWDRSGNGLYPGYRSHVGKCAEVRGERYIGRRRIQRNIRTHGCANLAFLIGELRRERDEDEHPERDSEGDDDGDIRGSSRVPPQVPADDVVQVLRERLADAGGPFVDSTRGTGQQPGRPDDEEDRREGEDDEKERTNEKREKVLRIRTRIEDHPVRDDGQRDEKDVNPRPILNPSLTWRVVPEGLHNWDARRSPRRTDARDRHENHGQDRHDDDRRRGEDDDLVSRSGRSAERTHEGEQETTQAHSCKEAHDRRNRSTECRFDEQKPNKLAGCRAAGLQDCQLAPPLSVAQVHSNRPEVDAEQQHRSGEREVDDPLNRDGRGEVANRIPDVVDGHLTLERREDLVDLAVETRKVSLGRREVVRIEKPIPIDSDFSRNGIPAVRDHAQLLFIPVDIPDLDESCRGRIERALAGIRIPEEATDRDIEARECLVSGDVVRTVHESGGAVQGDVHLLGEVLAQRDRASWK